VVLEVLVGNTATTVLDTRLRVVATAKAARNRAPVKVGVRLGAPKADAARPTLCTIDASLTREDPDHDLVSFRYEWRVGGKLVRALQSAALTDRLPAGAAGVKDKVSCKVRPHDGKAAGPWSEARTK
jgi:hypothetical protein